MTTVEVVALLGVVWFIFSLRFGAYFSVVVVIVGAIVFGLVVVCSAAGFVSLPVSSSLHMTRLGIQELLIVFNISNFMQILLNRKC